ncbi:MAG: DsbA family protein [Sphingobacteriia bacterium]|nr:DsbA family protein [Sphingobacteriia bacterium]
MIRNNKKKGNLKYILITLAAVVMYFTFQDQVDSYVNAKALSSDEAKANTNVNDTKLKDIIRNEIRITLQENPEIVIDALKAYEKKEYEKRASESNNLIEKNINEINEINNIPYAGTKHGKNIVVQFFDYNCSFCRKAAETVEELSKEDKNTVFIFRDLPILGENSEFASQVGVAVFKIKPEAYKDYYFKVFNSFTKDKETLKAIAISLGINKDELDEALKSSFVSEFLNKNRDLARKLQLPGTPYFIVNNKVYNGNISAESLKQALNR